MSNISRRAVLSTGGRAAVATLALGGVSVAATDPTADAELIRLEAMFNEADQGFRLEDEEASNSGYEQAEALADEILSIPAVTLAGVMVKVRLGTWFEDGDEEGMAEMHKSITADLEAMTGGQANV